MELEYTLFNNLLLTKYIPSKVFGSAYFHSHEMVDGTRKRVDFILVINRPNLNTFPSISDALKKRYYECFKY